MQELDITLYNSRKKCYCTFQDYIDYYYSLFGRDHMIVGFITTYAISFYHN